MRLNAIAIDDEPKALEIIRNHAQKVPSLIVEETFTDPFKALAYLEVHAIDLIFLDINMPDMSGLEFTKAIRKKKTLVIFTTAYSEFALESYEVDALDYLLKPFAFTRFLSAIHKAEERLKKPLYAERDYYFVNSGNQQHKLSLEDITLIEGNGNYVTYFTQTGKLMIRSSIRETMATLPEDHFVQIQRSYIISLKNIDKIQDNHVYIGNHRISIGATYRDNFKSLIEGLSRKSC